ncbi:MAG: glycosyltransferase family 2 protein [Bdellovibrionales bacterium]|nr:glycosyltransferase family 2 protein [Bdellovibrionales bacterium]
MSKCLISAIVPLYNEEDNVAQLYAELVAVADSSGLAFEFVFVDDGSADRTAERLAEAANGDPRVRLVLLRRNFGQTAAMAAGIDHARGDIVVTLDGDLQNDPAEIPKMVEKLDEGYDLVAGWRKNRQDRMLSRKLPSMIANRLISKTTNVQLHDYGCTLKVMRADVARNIQLYGEMHRFIPALAAQMGVRIAEMPVNHRARVHGTSKYGISRTFRVLLDLLTVRFFLGFSTRPLHMFGALGMITGGIGGIALFALTVEKFFLGMAIGDRPLLFVSIMLVLIGSQFICFGLLAEMLVRTYHESQNKKIYAVREVLEFRGSTTSGPQRQGGESQNRVARIA